MSSARFQSQQTARVRRRRPGSSVSSAPATPGEKIWIKSGSGGRAELGGVQNNLQLDLRTDSLPSPLWEYIPFFFFFFFSPLRATPHHVSAGILCRLFQMRTPSLSEDFASCACRVARPQPRGFSVRQQGDGQHNSATRGDGLPQVSPCSFCLVITSTHFAILFHSS